jgi:hypothetical protein
MGRPRVLLLTLLLIAVLGGAAEGAIAAEFAFADLPRGQQWELLQVRFQSPPEGGRITVQDGRGGMVVSRSLDAGIVEGQTGAARIFLPLPLLAPADFGRGAWPIEVTVRSAAGGVVQERVQVAQPASIASSFRIVRAVGGEGRNLPSPEALPWERVIPTAPVFIALTEDEILAGPPLLFATCDGLLLSESLANRLSTERIAALLNAGVRLISVRDPAAPRNSSAVTGLNWEAISEPNRPALWITRSVSVAKPQVLEPNLAAARTLRLAATPTWATILIVMLIPVGALIVLLLARGLFRRRALVFLAVVIGMVLLTWAALAYLHSSTQPLTQTLSWTTTHNNAGSAIAVTENFHTTTALFGQQLRASAEQDMLLFPVAANPHAYFVLREATLFLDALSDDGLRRVSRLQMPLAPRDAIAYATRSAAIVPPAVTGNRGVTIEAGYVTILDAAPRSEPILFTQWVNRHPDSRNALLAWYELRFQPNRRYFLAPVTGAAPLAFTDFGTPATAPTTR